MHPYLTSQFAAERQADRLAWARQQNLVRQARAARRAAQAGPVRQPRRPLRVAAWPRPRTAA
jgi:hypothetical protein